MQVTHRYDYGKKNITPLPSVSLGRYMVATSCEFVEIKQSHETTTGTRKANVSTPDTKKKKKHFL